ncbi:hypothetical protein [Mesorhizobium sp. B2-6-2]|uniref:hypothetical protein n=1 Tax=Mesorhizobium sp. B2-6-2 TaxID=2589915 RepID=UPI0015E3A131|nr:hypothetical protein [Mesorhizobium sp. B2-6-2]
MLSIDTFGEIFGQQRQHDLQILLGLFGPHSGDDACAMGAEIGAKRGGEIVDERPSRALRAGARSGSGLGGFRLSPRPLRADGLAAPAFVNHA